MLATILIFGSFIGLAAIFFLVLVPMLWNQTISLLSDLPAMFNKSNEWLLNLPEIILNLLIIQWLILFSILYEKKSLVLVNQL